jgi:UDPglucose--hexose-1-phosphate uridylyltransferase
MGHKKRNKEDMAGSFDLSSLTPLAPESMKPEIRRDPVTGNWVIIAPERAKRPSDRRAKPAPQPVILCPFCEGHEDQTPPEILAYRSPGSRANEKGWRVRVVPNKFPALEKNREPRDFTQGIYQKIDGAGAHEIIIECPHHETSMARLSEKNVGEVLSAYRERLIELKTDRRLAYGLIFKNEGEIGGASLEHSHSQLVGLPMVPAAVQAELDGARKFFETTGRCIYCEILTEEFLSALEVFGTAGFIAFIPYAARFPFETWILPRHHGSHFEEIQNAAIQELASALKTIVTKLELGLNQPPYNYVLHTAPFEAHSLPHYHWHIEITPRLTHLAGFELGSGLYINPVPPELAATFLRQVDPPERALRSRTPG